MSNYYHVLGDMKKAARKSSLLYYKNGAWHHFMPFLQTLFLDFMLADFVIQRLSCNTQYFSGIAFVPMGVSQNSDNMILLYISYRAKRRWDYLAAFADMNG